MQQISGGESVCRSSAIFVLFVIFIIFVLNLGLAISVGLLISVKGYCNLGEKSGMRLFPSVTMKPFNSWVGVLLRAAQVVDIYRME